MINPSTLYVPGGHWVHSLCFGFGTLPGAHINRAEVDGVGVSVAVDGVPDSDGEDVHEKLGVEDGVTDPDTVAVEDLVKSLVPVGVTLLDPVGVGNEVNVSFTQLL